MIRNQKETPKIIVQKRKDTLTDYRIIIYKKRKIEVINIFDGANINRDEIVVESRHMYTKRAGKLYQYMTRTKKYCGLTTKDFKKRGFSPKILTETLINILNKKSTNYKNPNWYFTDEEYGKWIKYFQVPLENKNINPHTIRHHMEIPF